MDAIKGATKEIEIDGKKHKIKIPAGARDGTRIRFQGFDISLDVKSHPRYRREGYDLYVTQKVPFTMATLGGKKEIKTLNGDLKLKIRPGTQAGTMVRLRGEGVKHLRGKGKGDLYVKLEVEVPENLTKEQRKLIEQLKEAGL